MLAAKGATNGLQSYSDAIYKMGNVQPLLAVMVNEEQRMVDFKVARMSSRKDECSRDNRHSWRTQSREPHQAQWFFQGLHSMIGF